MPQASVPPNEQPNDVGRIFALAHGRTGEQGSSRYWKQRDIRAIVAGMHLPMGHLRRLKKLLRRGGATPEDAEDLVQEAVLRLHAYTHAGREVHDPESFVARTALNLAVDASRSSWNRTGMSRSTS